MKWFRAYLGMIKRHEFIWSFPPTLPSNSHSMETQRRQFFCVVNLQCNCIWSIQQFQQFKKIKWMSSFDSFHIFFNLLFFLELSLLSWHLCNKHSSIHFLALHVGSSHCTAPLFQWSQLFYMLDDIFENEHSFARIIIITQIIKSANS